MDIPIFMALQILLDSELALHLLRSTCIFLRALKAVGEIDVHVTY